MPSTISQFLYRVSEPLFTVLVRSRDKEVKSKYFIYLITLIGYIQLSGLTIITRLPDESLSLDTALLTFINWCDLLQLIDHYIPSDNVKLYVAVGIQIFIAITFFLLLGLEFKKISEGFFTKLALKIVGIYNQIHISIFLIPTLKICFNFFYTPESQLLSRILAWIIVWWPIAYAFYIEVRYSINTEFYLLRTNHKKVTLSFYVKLGVILALVIVNRAYYQRQYFSVHSDSKANATTVCAISVAAAAILIILYFREMYLRKRSYASFVLISHVLWITCSLFVYLRIYQGINSLIYIIAILSAMMGYGIYNIHLAWIKHLILGVDTGSLSDNHFDFVVRDVFQTYKTAESGNAISKHMIFVFVENYIRKWYPKVAKDIEFQNMALDAMNRYEERFKNDIHVSSSKNVFMSNLKTLTLIVLDQLYKKRIMKQSKRVSFNLILGYLSFIIRHFKNGIKASKVLLNYSEKVSKNSTLSLVNKFALERLLGEMKQIIHHKMNNQFCQEADYSDVIKFHQQRAQTRTLLLSILQRYGELYTLLLNKNIDLDKLSKDGGTIVSDKKILEDNFKKLFLMNALNRETFFLYRTYLSLDVSTSQVEGMRIIEAKMVEHNAKNIKVLSDELQKKLNIFANNSGVMYISLYEKRLGKILKCTPEVVRILGYQEAEMKYLDLDSIQPACIAEVHRDILTERLETARKMKDQFIVPAVDKEKFIVPIMLVLKFEQFEEELCSAAFLYKRYIPYDWLILDKFGYLLNYTEQFHGKIFAPKNKKPIYGLHIATFLPKLISVFFDSYKATLGFEKELLFTQTTEYQKSTTKTDGSTVSENIHDQKIRLGEVCTANMLIPVLPQRLIELEAILSAITKTATVTKQINLDKNHNAIELFLKATDALIARSTPENVRMFQTNFTINHVVKTFKASQLDYYSLEIHSLNLITDPKLVNNELTNYRSFLLTAKAGIQKLKFDGTPFRQQIEAATLGLRTMKSLGVSRPRGGIQHNDSNAINRLKFTGLTEHEPIEEVHKEGDMSEEQEVKERLHSSSREKKSEQDQQLFGGKSLESSVDYLPNDDSFENDLLNKLNQLGKARTYDETAENQAMRNEEDPEDVLFSKKSFRGLDSQRSPTDRIDVSDGKKSLLASSFVFSAGEMLRGGVKNQKESSFKQENSEMMMTFPLTPKGEEMRLLSTHRTEQLTLPGPDNTSSKKDLFLAPNLKIPVPNSRDKGMMSQTASADQAKLTSEPTLQSKVPESNSSQLMRDEFERSAGEENKKDRGLENIAQSSSAQTKTTNQITQYQQLIFDKSVPTFLIRFDIFGTIAILILLILVFILFFLLTQLLTQFRGYIKISSYPNYMLSPFIQFFVEGERIIMENDGLLDQDNLTTEQAYSATLLFLQEQYQLFKERYETTAMITNVADVSNTFEYEDFSFTIYEPNLDEQGSVTAIPNFAYTGATVRLLSFMSEFLRAEFPTISNTTSFIVYFRENFNGYFHAFENATNTLFLDLYGDTKTIDVQNFSEISLGISLGILFVFIAAIYPLYRKNEDIQIKALSLFGTFTSSEIEKKFYKFKAIHTLVSTNREGTNSGYIEVKRRHEDKATRTTSKRLVSSWTKKRANTFTLVAALTIMYGLMSIYFIVDSVKITSQNNAFLPLASEFDISTDTYSYLPCTLAIAFSEINLYKIEGQTDKIQSILDGYESSKEKIKTRVSNLTAHFSELEEYIQSTLVTPEYVELLTKLRSEDLCQAVSDHGDIPLNQSEIDSCQNLAQGLAGAGVAAIFRSYHELMITFTNIVEKTGFTRENAHKIVNSQEFGEYHQLIRYLNEAFLIWIDGQTANTEAALDYQQSSAIQSFVGGTAMLVLTYLIIWRSFIKLLKRKFSDAKALYSLIPADLLLTNNYVKKFLRDREKVTA